MTEYRIQYCYTLFGGEFVLKYKKYIKIFKWKIPIRTKVDIVGGKLGLIQFTEDYPNIEEYFDKMKKEEQRIKNYHKTIYLP